MCNQGSLERLFPDLSVEATAFVGESRNRTNPLSAALNDWAGNPWGTYGQEEACVACGAEIVRPPTRSPMQRAASKVAHLLNGVQRPFLKPRPTWIHVLFSRPA